MLDRLQTALQSVDSITDHSEEWLWELLSSLPLSPLLIDRSLSLLKKLKHLNLDSPYILSTLLFFLFPGKEDFSGREEKISPLILKHYESLQNIFSLAPSLRSRNQEELFLKMLIAMTKDLQLLASILAIQLQGLESVEDLSEEEQRVYSRKILAVYAPLAERLGIFWIKSELEDIALRYVAPEIYYELKQKVAKKRNDRSRMIEEITQEIRQLMEETEIQHEVQGRYKRFYSIYQKLQKVDYDFDRIQDLIGFRILVNNVHDCYKALGYVHERWSPKPGRFKDYISKPKPNRYRSLHTTVLDVNGESIEIQIRTHEMHEVAEFGVAAHWQYKKGINQHNGNSEFYDNLRKKANNEFEGDRRPVKNTGDDLSNKIVGFNRGRKLGGDREALETEISSPGIDFLENKIYVLTPQNDVIELPKGATPVDFAYAIHSKVGDHITAAKVNGRILKLDDCLSNGNCVEVINSPKQTPRYEWLKFVKTSKAKNKIRHAVRKKDRETNKKVGMELLDKEFKRHGLNFNRVVKDGTLEKMVLQRKSHPLEQTVCAIGEGGMKAGEVVQWFLAPVEVKTEEDSAQTSPDKKKLRSSIERKGKYVIVEGMDNMLVRFAKCCSPENGSKIYGYLTQGRGITIHRVECPDFQRLDGSRQISAHWGEVPDAKTA
ncbi:MAG: bifunctional (p)ppGpp synthetase/guanosine-3',5'-bis(diphosphate) 3'-pyrophosphohydrolase [SAR324 cluster bacterium]|nr:bifunctional (p)ppGpp synthetase/guanosine-3',5'-bis(diphosphate) 3'-pyrophosphohydrolase [SAR324 cluster bacterium]